MALIGVLLLVLFLLLRPMDLWPEIARLHSLEVLTAMTALGVGWETTAGRRASGPSPQLPWLVAFVVWSHAVSVARLGVEPGLQAGWSVTLGPIFMLIVILAVRGIERLRAMVLLLLACAAFVSVVVVHQGAQPRQCIELREPEGAWVAVGTHVEPERVPDGRACEGPRQCEAGGLPGADYACERAGAFGTFSTQGRVRWRGQLDDPNEVAVVIGALLPFLFMFAAKRPGAGPAERARRATTLLVVALLVALGLWAMVLTQSRGGQLVFGAVMMCILVRRLGWWSVLAGVVLTVPMVVLSWRSGVDAESSSIERAEILSEGLQMLKAHPLVGIGVGQFAGENPLNMAAHNSYLLIATEAGLPGYLLWCGLVWMTVKIPFTVATRPPPGLDRRLVRFADALAASTLGLLIGVFFLSFVYKHVFFVWLGLAGALHETVRTARPDFRVRMTGRDLLGVCALAVAALVAVRVVSMTAR